jgi:hypothetical protein
LASYGWRLDELLDAPLAAATVDPRLIIAGLGETNGVGSGTSLAALAQWDAADSKRPSFIEANARVAEEAAASITASTKETNGHDDGESKKETKTKKPTKSTAAAKKGKTIATVKYTPLEKQVIAIKERHPDVILFVEVGYKYRFFGPDAEVGIRRFIDTVSSAYCVMVEFRLRRSCLIFTVIPCKTL